MEMFRTVRVIFVSVRTQFSSRLPLLLIAGMILMALPPRACAQDDGSDTPLGDVARNFRKKPSTSEVVIDNDNFSKVVEDAESRRTSGSTMVFSLDPGGKQFHVSSPDVSCSLSFSGKTSSLLSDPAMLDELPRNELAKLDGPATIDGDSLQVSVHNGTSWELREVVIGLTILRQPEDHSASSAGVSASEDCTRRRGGQCAGCTRYISKAARQHGAIASERIRRSFSHSPFSNATQLCPVSGSGMALGDCAGKRRTAATGCTRSCAAGAGFASISRIAGGSACSDSERSFRRPNRCGRSSSLISPWTLDVPPHPSRSSFKS